MKAQLQSIICAPLLGQSDIHLVQQHRKNLQRRQEYGGHTCQYNVKICVPVLSYAQKIYSRIMPPLIRRHWWYRKWEWVPELIYSKYCTMHKLFCNLGKTVRYSLLAYLGLEWCVTVTIPYAYIKEMKNCDLELFLLDEKAKSVVISKSQYYQVLT